MKDLLNAISKFPNYSEEQWKQIVYLKNGPSARHRTAADIINYQALVAETKARQIYYSLLSTLESQAPHTLLKQIKEFIDTINACGNEIMQEQATLAGKPHTKFTFNGEDLPPIIEGLLPAELSAKELTELNNHINSLYHMLYLNLIKHLSDDGKLIDAEHDIGFHSVSEAEYYLLPFCNALGGQIKERSPKECDTIPLPPYKSSDVVVKTIEKLQHRFDKDTQDKLTAEKLTAEKKKAATIKQQFDSALISRNDIRLCFLINKEMDAYKTILEAAIKAELKTRDLGTYIEYFQSFRFQLADSASADPILDLYRDLPSTGPGIAPVPLKAGTKPGTIVDFTSEQAKKSFRQIIKSNPNLGRMIANYHVIASAQVQLNQTSEDGLPLAADRLRNLFHNSATIGKQLQFCGNKTVNHATMGILNIFRWMYTNLCWYFSRERRHEQRFIRATDKLAGEARSRLFTPTTTTPKMPTVELLSSRKPV
jgi:hypothetical protein